MTYAETHDYTETTKRERKARTPKICNECKTEIQRGEIFIANSALENGKYTAMHRHGDCIEAADALSMEITDNRAHRLFLKPMIDAHEHLKPHLIEILEDWPLVLERVL